MDLISIEEVSTVYLFTTVSLTDLNIEIVEWAAKKIEYQKISFCQPFQMRNE